ncbi:hypothetical protein F3Y22_tig00110940pilonHSYRG00463 [Hibiscus syriacus]|uniref:Uncharacterized protein n=1 Tax=Hibiscus syriacus TaxID=106335 RepID=A0A6A2ZBS0_HIBSY|nr:hypothetical protein F3Y22_tig00110940pilonHSYRG00463 [Hibiscus syriacus]
MLVQRRETGSSVGQGMIVIRVSTVLNVMISPSKHFHFRGVEDDIVIDVRFGAKRAKAIVQRERKGG